jgi:DNA replication ATP-dependent helicase Dna2
VERFQGSTKEMVILSTCIQYDSQWDSIMSMSMDGQVDRKLNVALSRARKHLFVVGNKSILQGNQYYAKLTQWMYAYEGEVILSE